MEKDNVKSETTKIVVIIGDYKQFSSVQFSHLVVSDSLRPHEFLFHLYIILERERLFKISAQNHLL